MLRFARPFAGAASRRLLLLSRPAAGRSALIHQGARAIRIAHSFLHVQLIPAFAGTKPLQAMAVINGQHLPDSAAPFLA